MFCFLFDLWFSLLGLFAGYFAGNMSPRVAPLQQQRNVSSLHPFYQFPDDLPQQMLSNYKNKLGWIYNREFAISPTIDWNKLNEIGMLERLNLYFMKSFF